MRIVVTGTQGQIDTSIQRLGERLGISITRVGLPDVDLASIDTLDAAVRAARPDVIISAAAYTSVDKAESEPELAQKINGDAPGALARIANDTGLPLLHLSTDYVFSGDKLGAYTETDAPAPIGVYGKTKLSGEQQIRNATDNHVILRTAWVYSPYGNNFVKTMLRLGETNDRVTVVDDQFGCPTYAPDIARALLVIAQQVVNDRDETLRGVFNLTGEGETTWANFARAIFAGAERRGRRPVQVDNISSQAYQAVAKRPLNSRLSRDKLDDVYGLRLDGWQTSLDRCLDQLIAPLRE
ncbi:dTDP-4-dehydrorhamnose reductase [Asticcacaulis sp. 201]|uniref:dTDP-4-dehydrorhamnose reductase n=1 Tax=Asticcacaulis sp. 201 TaxID=3028787 RepID=UPI0029164CA5|nr:dTDP-4-dehydrorhamnose reductase [Asticcacaulis sp. 201]MDV6331049.1 dTDP-4-dehydrorhamnose reductase [Asticcacaulis sp. 201]